MKEPMFSTEYYQITMSQLRVLLQCKELRICREMLDPFKS
jgi:hypothetical protein